MNVEFFWMPQRRSPLALSYARFLWFVIILMILGEGTAILAASGLVSMETFAGMPFAGPETFTLLAAADPFVVVYLALLATRNFEDLVATDQGIALPVRSFRQMIRNARRVVPFADVETVRLFERRGADFVELRLLPAPGRRASLVLPGLWIPDEGAFVAGLHDRVGMIQSRPLRGAAGAS